MNTSLHKSYRAEFVKLVAAAGTPVRFTARSVTSIARSSTTRRCLVTITNHGYTPGAIVYISGAAEAEFNTADGATVVQVVGADSFYVMLDYTSATSASGTVVCYADIWVRQATVLGKKAEQTVNVGNVYIGTKAAVGKQAYTIVSDAEASLPAGREGVGPLVNLADWYVDAANNGDGIYVFYF